MFPPVNQAAGRGTPARLTMPVPLTACLALLAVVAAVTAGAAAARQVTDAEITEAVESALWNDPVVNANTLDVATSDGIVELAGTASNILVRDRAVRIAATTGGVRGVLDRIEVWPADPASARSDRAIQRDVMKALGRDPATEAYEVSATVDDGVVTLDGRVGSRAERRLASQVAKGVRGVTGVVNHVNVERYARRPDGEIAAEIEARLTNDVRVDDEEVRVRVADGVAHLEGTVGSLAEKRLAKQAAWVDGVKDIRAGGLAVEPWARDRLRTKAVREPRTDAEIRRAVIAALRHDPRVEEGRLDITVRGATVTLQGIVDNARAKRVAGEDVANVTGVFAVRNHIKVRPDRIPPGRELEQRVREALGTDPVVERHEIEVTARDGRVTLDGLVEGSYEKTRAGAVAFGVEGVVDVTNRLDYQYQWAWRPDPVIAEEVRDQLYWSPYVDHEAVEVAVQDGVVTLTGRVTTLAEHEAAETNAWEGGARDVINRLEVANRVGGPAPRRFELPGEQGRTRTGPPGAGATERGGS